MLKSTERTAHGRQMGCPHADTTKASWTDTSSSKHTGPEKCRYGAWGKFRCHNSLISLKTSCSHHGASEVQQLKQVC